MRRLAVDRKLEPELTPAKAPAFPRLRRILLLEIVFPALFAGALPTIAETPRPVELTSVHQIRLLKATTNNGFSAHLQGVVTYYDTVAPNLFVQDSTGGIWVDLNGSTAKPPSPGQVLDLRGIVNFGFSPYIQNPHWNVTGKSAPPKPRLISYDDAATGSFDGQWVQLDGVVRSFVQQAEGNVLVIDVATPTGAFKVRVPGYQGPFPVQLIDAKVRFSGVCGASFNSRNQFVSFHIFMPSLDNLKVLQTAPKDPFAVPAIPIADVRRFSADLPVEHRVKVVGTVTARFPQQGIYMTDGTGGFYAESQDGSPIREGDQVEVIGFPAAGNFSPVLKSASFRPTGQHFSPTITPIIGRVALKGKFDAQLISITGTLTNHLQHLNQQILVVESDDHVIFEADLAHSGSSPLNIAEGSRISLTGICAVKADENGNPSEFEVVLRSPQDIQVLSSPTWLTPERAVYLLFGLTMATLAVIGWVFILRRRVHRQTDIITAKLKNEMALEARYRNIFERNLTGLYIAEADGKLLDCNDACARMLGYRGRHELLGDSARAEQIVQKFHETVADSSFTSATEQSFERLDGTQGWALCSLKAAGGQNDEARIFEGSLVDITERKLAEDRIQFLAYFDSLTNLPNRALVHDRLSRAISVAKRERQKLGVLHLDIDSFKVINDCLGHSRGDELLQSIAQRLQACAREEDTVARLGGDEFLVTLGPINSPADAAIVAERIANELKPAFNLNGNSLNVTCSIGISIFPDHGNDVETLIKNADAAMYASKGRGRNTFSFFSEQMTAQAVERLQLDNTMRGALDREEFYLVFQPEFNLQTGAVSCWEALIRWKHPELGLVPPDKFIPIAEANGMIVPIGEWVLRTACNHARSWHNIGSRVPVAVNVSAVQFRQIGFCELVRKVLKETGLDPEHLELEITESLLIATEDMRFEVLSQLKALGVRLAIDDFGTGYSSLSYLKQLPVSKLKIDRSFIHDLHHNGNEEAITAAIIQMAKCLNLTVTAEGVENERQLQFLREQQCDDVQGFLFSKPLKADQMDFQNRKASALFEILSMGAAS
ncbi:MAG TPA: EAL domain-containing protein [Terracidiphilus sp.]|nr:EAL domain-containing protein [Terracidiphilus sp.]